MKLSLRARPAKPKVRGVLLDSGFIGALIATDAPHHDDACRVYAELVERYAAGADRLFALSDVLGDLPREFRRNALAPVIAIRVARQHRTAARRTVDRSPDTALSLVIMRRERIRAVATASHEFDDVDVIVLHVDQLPLGLHSDLDAEAAAMEAAISSRTAPPLAPQSTDG